MTALRHKILLIEDDAGHSVLTEKMLSRRADSFPHELVRAASLEEGFALLERKRFDLLLLDLGLPESRGLETLEAVVSRKPPIPVVVLTSLDDETTGGAAIDAGAEDYLIKDSMTPELLSRTLHQNIRRFRLAKNFSFMIEKNADPMLIVDDRRCIRFANPAALDFFDKKPTELAGRPFEYPLALDRPAVVETRDRAGAKRFAEMRVSEVEWEGRPANLATLRDVTDRRHVEQSLSRHHRRLEKRVRERTREIERSSKILRDSDLLLKAARKKESRFLGAMSHELRTPLNGILGFTELLKQQLYGPLNERQMHYVRQIEQCGKSQLELVNSLLEITKSDAGELELRREKVLVRDLFEHMRSVMKSPLAKKAVSLHGELDDPGLEIRADIAKLQEILFHLLSNAIKFTPENGTVTLHAGRSKKGIAIRVSDTGPGISNEERERIFADFYQGEETRKHALGGTGIGLPLCRRLAELHGGKIRVESRPGAGSTFTVFLPDA